MTEQQEKELHPVYQGLFWCSERKDFFRWYEFINYYKQSKDEGE